MLSETKYRPALAETLREGRYAGKNNEFSISIILLICCIITSCSERITNPPVEELNDITNPPGGYIDELAINLQGDFFVSTSNGLFRSMDNGSSWDTVRGGMSFTELKITTNDDIFISLYFLNDTEIFRSTDNGNSWISLISPVLYVYSIEEDQNGDIYVCGVGGLFKSTDKGNSWEEIYPGSVFNVCTVNDNSIIIGIPGDFVGQLLYSPDNGNSWDSTGHNLNLSALYKYGSFVFAGGFFGDEGGGGVHKTTNGGINWESCGLDFRSVTSFVTNELNQLFVGTDEGIYFTDDNGISWQNALTDSVITTLMRDSKDYLYAGTNEGTFLRSTDNGMNWHN